MANKLTPAQTRQVRAHHRKALTPPQESKSISYKLLTMEEAAKLLPGMVMQHKFTSKDVRRRK